MLKHADIWSAIDRLAREKGLSPSGLARGAGLDPTTFNRSKRVTHQGKERWPSTESISKILSATNTPLDRFAELTFPDSRARQKRTVPFINQGNIANPDLFDELGRPSESQWDAILAPMIDDPFAFAIEVEGNLLEPIFRDGDILVLSPSTPPRKLDRVMTHTFSGDVIFGVLQRQTARHIDICPFDQSGEINLPLKEIRQMARLMWASQ